jgi:hypothetical protein
MEPGGEIHARRRLGEDINLTPGDGARESFQPLLIPKSSMLTLASVNLQHLKLSASIIL